MADTLRGPSGVRAAAKRRVARCACAARAGVTLLAIDHRQLIVVHHMFHCNPVLGLHEQTYATLTTARSPLVPPPLPVCFPPAPRSLLG